MRREKAVAYTESSSSEESGDEDIDGRRREEDVQREIARQFRKERSDSEEEEDIPLMELSKRLKARDRPVAESSDDEADAMSDETLSMGEDEHDIGADSQQEGLEDDDSSMEVDAVISSKAKLGKQGVETPAHTQTFPFLG